MIKPRHWPHIEFLPSGGQESQCLSWLNNNLSVRTAELARRIRKRERRLQSTCPTNLPEPFSLESILTSHMESMCDTCVTRKDLESEWLARDNSETNWITIKPQTVNHVAEQFFRVPLPSCSPPGCPLPIKSLALSARLSPRKIHFRVLEQSPLSGSGRGPPSCNSTNYCCCYLWAQNASN